MNTPAPASRLWLLLAVMAGGGALVYLLAPVLTPFLSAALLAYLGDPVVDRIQARRVPRTVAVVIVFVLLLVILLLAALLLVPALEAQIRSLLTRIPEYLDWLQRQVLPWLGQTLGVDVTLLDWQQVQDAVQAHWSEVGGFAGAFLAWISQSGLALLAWVANLVLIPVVTFYLLRDWDVLLGRLRDLLPRQWEADVARLACESDMVLGAFFRGQLLVMLALSVIYALGLWLIGLELALIIGVIAGLVSFVPYLGFIVGILLAGIAALMQFQEAYYLLWVALVFGLGQMLEGMWLTPTLVGDRIGLHPVAVIFAVMAGGQLFGFVGVLLALPAAAVIMVLLRDVHRRYRASALYADAVPGPDTRSE